MKRLKNLILVITAIVCALIVFLFSNSIKTTHMDSDDQSYLIMGMEGGIDSRRFNQAIEEFTTKHEIRAIKIFSVPVVNKGATIETKFYVYGKSTKLPKGTYATDEELAISDIRYPLHFRGKIDRSSIEKMFEENKIEYEYLDGNLVWLLKQFIFEYNLLPIFILFIVLLSITLLFSHVKELKKANIRYLLGMTKGKDAALALWENQKIFLPAFVGAMILVYILWLLQGMLHIQRTALIFASCLFIGVVLLDLFFVFIRINIYSYQTIVPTIKGKDGSALIFVMSFIMKSVIEIFILFMVVSLTQSIQAKNQVSTQLEHWNREQDYYTVYLAPIGQLTSEEHEELHYNIARFYQFLEQNNGSLTYYNGWGEETYSNLDMFNGNVLSVNANYLQKNPIIDKNGNTIELPSNSETLYLLIPSSEIDKKEQLVESYEDSLWIDSAKAVTSYELKTEVIEIQENQKLFTYNSNALDFGFYDGYVTNAIVIVLSSSSLGGPLINNIDTNATWTVFLSNQAFLAPDVSVVKEGIERFGLTKYIGGILNTRERAFAELSIIQNSIYISWSMLSLAIFLLCMGIFICNRIYFKNNQKKITVKYISGVSFINRYRTFMVGILSFALMESLLIYLITKQSWLAMVFLLMVSFGHIGLLAFQSKIANYYTIDILKGE